MGNRRGKVESVTGFLFLGSRVTADSDCSHEIKKLLLLGRKAVTDLDSILKTRDIALPAKVCLVKAVVFPVAMCGCESWTIRRTLRRPSTEVLVLSNRGVREDSCESLGLQGEQRSLGPAHWSTFLCCNTAVSEIPVVMAAERRGRCWNQGDRSSRWMTRNSSCRASLSVSFWFVLCTAF